MVEATRDARALIARYHQAMLAKDSVALASLYAEDAIHEFPLLTPFFPQRLVGRAEISAHYGAVWSASPIRILSIRNVALHETLEPNVVISEAEYTADAPGTDPFSLAFAIVAHLGGGEIAYLRDYMDALGAAHRLGRLDAVVRALSRRSE